MGEEPRASGSLVTGGGCSVWGPGFVFARLAFGLLAYGFPTQVTGDHAAGGLRF